MRTRIDFETLCELKRRNASWKLMTADNAPLIVSFLNEAFILPNSRILPESALAERLEDKLFALREQCGHESFPRKSIDYLKEWAEPEKGWLRRFYPNNSDEPHYDITPAAEKAISWADSLTGVSFVGTESRLKTIFGLIRQMVEGSESDEKVRIADLKKRRGEIDEEIAKIERGEMSLLDAASLKDRFHQFSTTAMELLSDFRSVEYNFRELDRGMRERIALWEGGKGALLDEILGKHDAISDSDQGRSFRAFMDFLLSRRLQQELEERLDKVMEMPAVREMMPDRRLAGIHTLWLDASTHVQEVAASLSSQLRRFLDSGVWMENRRIGEIFKHIQESAIKVRSDPPMENFMEIDDISVEMKLIMERPMFTEKSRVKIESSELLSGDAEEVDASELYEVMYVDTGALEENIKLELLHASQITLAELISVHPPARGLAEIIAYMNIASKREGSVFDDTVSDELSWRNERGIDVIARAPRIIFTR